jgi:hypothetical protein
LVSNNGDPDYAEWKIMQGNSGPVTVHLDLSDTVLGSDFYDVIQRMGIENRFFNIEHGETGETVFDFPKKE